MKKTISSLTKLIKIEFKIQMNPTSILIALFIAFIPTINPMLSNFTMLNSFKNLARMFNEALIYGMLIRIYSIFKEGFQNDKNRVEYLVFSKNNVLIAKLVTNTVLFFITITTSIIGSLLIIAYWKNVSFTSDYIINVVAFIITAGVFYLFIAAGLLLIITSKTTNKRKVFLAIGWILLTLLAYLVLFIIIGIVRVKIEPFTLPSGFLVEYKWTVRIFFYDNIHWLAFIPFLNLGAMASILYGTIKWYWALPIIVQFFCFLVFITKKLAINCKEYLTT